MDLIACIKDLGILYMLLALGWEDSKQMTFFEWNSGLSAAIHYSIASLHYFSIVFYC